LAGDWDATMDPKGWWISEKFDGIRAFWTGSKLLTRYKRNFLENSFFRAGQEIKVPPFIKESLPLVALDGELW
jgi:DNA ligase-1